MRASMFIAASLSIGVVAACSNPASDTAGGTNTSFESELELAIFPQGADEMRVVVSELEILEPAPTPGSVSVREVRTPSPLPDAEPVITVVAPRSHSPSAVQGPPDIQPVILTGGASSDRPGAAERGRLTGVIIRGGVDARDPCVIHRPGGAAGALGGIGVLINDPTPRGAGIGIPRGSGPAISGSPRGGALFAGGIR